jgi:hypothetical protein
LIDRAQSARREKWKIKAAKNRNRYQRLRIKYPLRAPRKDVKIL